MPDQHTTDLGIFKVGPTSSPAMIAELSANHRSSKAAALELVAAAAEAGADAVKFQHFTAETLTVRSNHSDFRVRGARYGTAVNWRIFMRKQ